MEGGGLEKLVRSMNRSLPERRRSLEELMTQAHPALKCRNGSIISLEKNELEMIAPLLPKYEWNRLLLPIIIEMTPDFGGTAARIRGKLECVIVTKLLDLKKPAADQLILYLAEIRTLRRVLPTATHYGFYISTGT